MTEQPKTHQKKKKKTLKQFLEDTPPGQWADVSDVVSFEGGGRLLATPRLRLYCDNEECEGYRFFEGTYSGNWLSNQQSADTYITYACSNCKTRQKVYAVCLIVPNVFDTSGKIYKYGEHPMFGPPTPARAIKLIGPDKELFLTGRRAEIQGMGIGAFTYYRRVVENQKNRIFDEIIRVTRKIGTNDAVIADLERAKEETQFTKAVETIKHALPETLLINGHNPLVLLHSALSEGVHEHTEAECLELATSIRTILIEFADGLGQALKEEAELSAAVARLARKKTGKDSKSRD